MTVAFGRAATLAVLFWVSVRGLVCDCRLRSRRLLNCVSRSVLRSCPVGLHFQSWVVVPVPLTCCRCSLGFRPPVWPWSRPGGFAVVSPSCRLIPTHPLVCTRPSHSASCAGVRRGFLHRSSLGGFALPRLLALPPLCSPSITSSEVSPCCDCRVSFGLLWWVRPLLRLSGAVPSGDCLAPSGWLGCLLVAVCPFGGLSGRPATILVVRVCSSSLIGVGLVCGLAEVSLWVTAVRIGEGVRATVLSYIRFP